MPRFDADRLDRAFAVVERGRQKSMFPGAVAAVGGRDGLVALKAFGHAAVEPEEVPMAPDTLFDLASLTKVVGTTPAILRLLEEGAFVLETPVADIIPAFSDRRVTLRHLLTHTSGLPAWKGLYLDHRGLDEYTAAICALPLEQDPATKVNYSCLGFILLGAAIFAITGKTLDEYCAEVVFRPLGMSRTGWRPQEPHGSIAATETGNAIEYGMCQDRAAAFPRWRSGVICGEANDGNAYYGLDGIAGNAGLFGTAEDLAKYAATWLRGGAPILSPHTVALATRSHTPGLNENRGLGWSKPPVGPFPSGRSSAGDMLSQAAFGHTGFTGTSLWIDPEKELFAILLTNRLHPHARDGLIPLRPAFLNAVVAALR